MKRIEKSFFLSFLCSIREIYLYNLLIEGREERRFVGVAFAETLVKSASTLVEHKIRRMELKGFERIAVAPKVEVSLFVFVGLRVRGSFQGRRREWKEGEGRRRR